MASLLKKLGNLEKNSTIIDDQSKSAIYNPENPIDRNNIMSPKNDPNIGIKTPKDKKSFIFTGYSNPINGTNQLNIPNQASISSTLKERVSSPKANTEKIEFNKIEPGPIPQKQQSDYTNDKAGNKDRQILIQALEKAMSDPIGPAISNTNIDPAYYQNLLGGTLSPSARTANSQLQTSTSPQLRIVIPKEQNNMKGDITSPNSILTPSSRAHQNPNKNPTITNTPNTSRVLTTQTSREDINGNNSAKVGSTVEINLAPENISFGAQNFPTKETKNQEHPTVQPAQPQSKPQILQRQNTDPSLTKKTENKNEGSVTDIVNMIKVEYEISSINY